MPLTHLEEVLLWCAMQSLLLESEELASGTITVLQQLTTQFELKKS